MLRNEDQSINGIYAATVCPLTKSYQIDENALAIHLEKISDVDGIVGLLINGHAGENATLTRSEKRRVIEIANEVCGNRSVIVSGINCESSYAAQQEVNDAKTGGADISLIFPPYSWALSHTTEMAVNHHRIANEQAKMPLMLYQAGVNAGGMAYSRETLEALVSLPEVIGIKEGSWETSAYEANRTLVKRVAPHVAVMASGDEHLLTCFALGSEGSLVSLAIVIPELIVALDRAVANSDLETARQLNERIYPLASAIYGVDPGCHATARLKACLKILGMFDNDIVRPPIGSLSRHEISMLEQALKAAGF